MLVSSLNFNQSMVCTNPALLSGVEDRERVGERVRKREGKRERERERERGERERERERERGERERERERDGVEMCIIKKLHEKLEKFICPLLGVGNSRTEH